MNKLRKFGIVFGAIGWAGIFLTSNSVQRAYQGAKRRIFNSPPSGDAP